MSSFKEIKHMGFVHKDDLLGMSVYGHKILDVFEYVIKQMHGKDEGERPQFIPVVPTSLKCPKCNYEFKPEDARCPTCNTLPKPLNAEVHEALGHKIVFINGNEWVTLALGSGYMSIPNYSDSDELAVKAYLEYCKINDVYPKLYLYPQVNGSGWSLNMDDCGIQPYGKNLAKPLCEAIVTHAKKMREGS